MKRLTYIVSILLLAVNSFAQGHFVVAFTGNGQDHMNIFLVTANVGGVALEAGDEIAAFDGTICCGKVTLKQPIDINNNKTYIDIKASRKDEEKYNGYTVGNAITYKFWDSDKNREISGIMAEYFDSKTGTPTIAPKYSLSGSAFVKLTAAAPVNRDSDSVPELNQSVQDDHETLFSDNLSEEELNSNLKVQIQILTETDPIISDQKMIVYPNPTSGKVKVIFDHFLANNTYLTVCDLAGKTILKQYIRNKEEWIDLGGNPPGLYLLKPSLDELKVQKVILK